VDRVIIHRVSMILAEMGQKWPVSLVDDFDPDYCIKDYGPHRLYEFRLEIRDDVDLSDFVVSFCTVMEQYNKVSNIKSDFYEANEYPGPVKNWHTVYLTVTTI